MMKERIETKRTILLGLVDVSNVTSDEILTGQFPEKELKFIEKCLQELFIQGYIQDVNGIQKSFKSFGRFSITTKGEEHAERISHDDRWLEAMEICTRLCDHSERTVLSVHDQILQRDISKFVGNPFINIADAIYNLNSGFSGFGR